MDNIFTSENTNFESKDGCLAFLSAVDGIDTHEKAGKFFGANEYISRENPQDAIQTLREYSEVKFAAWVAKEKKLIGSAFQLSSLANSIYNELPDYAKW